MSGKTQSERTFDLLGPLPEPGSTTILEASAGTGKTFALAGLVTRYIAEGVARLDEMLLITFSRAATQELRDRVRRQIAEAVAAFDDHDLAGDNQVVRHLLAGTPAELADRRERLGDALAGFDAATIATIHQFCNVVLDSLGVAGDSDAGVRLVESLDEVIIEIVDDLYLARFGKDKDEPPLTYKRACKIAREVVNNPSTELRPRDPDPGSHAAACIEFADAVRAEIEIRKRRQGILGYDDLLTRLADACEADGSPARVRMSRRWPIVMVDEFQDTDPVQWRVIDHAFTGVSTLVLIGDPKQAIYAFRGGDIHTYLEAADTAEKQTMGTNWRSDSALVERLQSVLRGTRLGDPRIVVHDVEAHHRGSRLTGAPHNDPFRLRVVPRERFGKSGDKMIAIDDLRSFISADLAADIAALLAGPATFGGERVRAADIAVIVEKHKDARACFAALTEAGIPVVYTGDSDVFDSEACDDWLALLEAFDQPHRSGVVRAAAATMFFGHTAEDLAAGGDSLTDRVADTVREWADHARSCGVAAVFEAARLRGMADRTLSYRDGERYMTDMAHVTQLLQEAAHRDHLTLPALRDWLRDRREERGGSKEYNKRLDRDAAAVQLMTVHASKGLQFPIVYLPFAFNRNVQQRDEILFHDNGVRCLHIGGKGTPDYADVAVLGRREAAGDDSRLMYVAMTRAQAQVVAWWAPSRDEPNGGLSRLMRDRRPGDPVIPDVCSTKTVTDEQALDRFREWEAAGGPVVEIADDIATLAAVPAEPAPSNLAVRHFHRGIDTTWRRTSYSGLVRAAQETPGVSSEPEIVELDDEVADIALTSPTDFLAEAAAVASPMADLPMGAKFGTLVHAVLEHADPSAPDLAAELAAQITRHSVWWPVDVPTREFAAALLPLHDTPLGPLCDDLTLRQIGLGDRLCEMDFEFPLAGGDLRGEGGVPDIRLADVGRLLAEHLPADDPLASYVDRLTDAALGGQSLRGYLSGSLDVVFRIPSTDGHRYVVADYKTNWLGESDQPLTAADYTPDRMAEAMLHSDYPLQALLYSVVLHRFLRWRLPGYDPARHLGGVLYLFVRGMCGPDTPVFDGHPAGVFGWRPPARLVVELSDLLAGRKAAA